MDGSHWSIHIKNSYVECFCYMIQQFHHSLFLVFDMNMCLSHASVNTRQTARACTRVCERVNLVKRHSFFGGSFLQCPLIDEQGSSVRSPELRRPSRQVRILHLLVQSLGLSVLLPSDSLLTLRQTKPITSLMSDLFWVLSELQKVITFFQLLYVYCVKVCYFFDDSRFLVVVPFRSLRFASSIVGVRVGTSSFNKRLMSNATAKSVPLSINNIKGKPMKVVLHHFACSGYLLMFNCWF